MPQKIYDYIIVGQGIAGSLLAYRLLKENKSVIIIDNKHKHSSTKVAMGMINPITGRKFVKSWQFENLLTHSLELYKSLEQDFDTTLIHKKNVVRVVKGAKALNDWIMRSGDPAYQKYMLENAHFASKLDFSKDEHLVEITGSYQVDIAKLIILFQSYFASKELLFVDDFDYDLLVYSPNIKYKKLEAKNIIFAEGSQAVNNPFFNYLPFNLSKGEILALNIPSFTFKKCLKDVLFYIPKKEESTYWIGANYEWEDLSNIPTTKGREAIISKLHKSIPNYKIVNHYAAIRPTIKDRRPLIGVHPDHGNIFIFNGLGTKGTSLAPFYSKIMVEYLMGLIKVPKEVNISRF